MFLLRKLGSHNLNNTELSQTKVDIREKIMVKLLVVNPKWYSKIRDVKSPLMVHDCIKDSLNQNSVG